MAKSKLKLTPVDGVAGTSIPLQIKATKSDPTETLTFTIGPLPADSTLTAGTRDSNNVWTLQEGEEDGLRLIPGPGQTGPVILQVKAIETVSGGQPTIDAGTLTITIAELADDDYRQKRKDALVPATQGQLLAAVSLLLISTAMLFTTWIWLFGKVQDIATYEYTVAWQQPAGTVLASGTSSFWYDKKSEEIKHLGVIDDDSKTELIALLRIVREHGEKDKEATKDQVQNDDAVNDLTNDADKPHVEGNATVTPESDQKLQTYHSAIGELAYNSNQGSRSYLLLLLLLAGLSGTIGVQARAIGNFIHIACASNVLDLHRWWPWYIMRPALGFILGAILVVLVESQLFIPGESAAPKGTVWWLAIAFLVGFGADDFTGRLRLLSQTLFGRGSK